MDSDIPYRLLVALADHGGGGLDPRHHEGNHPLNATIFLMFAGGGITHRQLGEVSLLDAFADVESALA